MSKQQILYEGRDRTAIITLNRLAKLNPLTPITHRGLDEALKRAETNDDVRVVTVTGADAAVARETTARKC